MTPDITVCEISASATHDLRRRVLRDGAADADVEWADDDTPTTVHLAARIDDRICAISTWLVARDPKVLALDAVQLRGMATDPPMAGFGLGRSLLAAGVARAGSAGHERVWANARVTALGFYEAAGWTVSGPVFETWATGLPHRHVHIDLG